MMQQRQLEFSVGFDAIKGARPYQEDTLRVWPEPGDNQGAGAPELFVVLADGMGGHVSGEKASYLACRESVRHFSQTDGDAAIRLEGALNAANGSLQREIQANGTLAGMGCTLIAAYLDQAGLRWVSVGDSVMYLFRRNQLFRMNEDHSLGALLDKQASAKVITPEEARSSPNRRSLRSALTGSRIPLVDLEREASRLTTGDWLIVASDGIETLGPDTVATIIAQNLNRDPRVVIERLLQEVRRRNVQNQDNTSIIAVKVEARAIAGNPQQSGQTLRLDIETTDNATEIMVPMRRGEIVGHASELALRASTTEPLLTASGRRNTVVTVLVALCAVVLIAGALMIYFPTTLSGERANNGPSQNASPKGASKANLSEPK